MIRIFCTNTGTSREFQEGASLLEISEGFGFNEPFRILAAKVNNVAQGLRFRAYHNLNVEFVDYKAYIGREFYCRSLCLLLHKAAGDIFPGSTLTIKRPISKGYFCDWSKRTAPRVRKGRRRHQKQDGRACGLEYADTAPRAPDRRGHPHIQEKRPRRHSQTPRDQRRRLHDMLLTGRNYGLLL